MIGDSLPAAIAVENPQPEALQLELHADQLASACLAALAQSHAQVTAGAHQLRARENLDDLLRYLHTALALDDIELFHSFISWLGDVLVARGVPATVLGTWLVTVGEVLDDAGLHHAAMLIADARDRLEAGNKEDATPPEPRAASRPTSSKTGRSAPLDRNDG